MNLNYSGQNRSIEHPNICPHCHITNHPIHQWGTFSYDNDKKLIYISVWRCANNKCSHLIVAENKADEKPTTLNFNRFLNGLPKGPDWPKPILELKRPEKDGDENPLPSKFIQTYLQSLEAESYGLDELAGMGYRKSIEYLVKDWAIQNNPNNHKEIQKSWLGKVIKDYFSGDLKEILERATWLGNDQAHYNKLFEEYDIEILKELIDLIMVELDRQYKKAHYIQSITKQK